MFRQTFLAEAETARKPYSMAISLLFQTSVMGVLCLLPFVFTQALPSMQLKSVLAAPPKPPSVLKPTAAVTRLATESPRIFHLNSLPVRTIQASIQPRMQGAEPALSLGASDLDGDPKGVPFGGGNDSMPPAPPPPPTNPSSKQQGPIRVGSIATANIIHMVQPVYPPQARVSRVQGQVEFAATISKQGTIENLTVLHGHPLLINAARDAVLQWRYRPTLLNGEPVEVITDIIVNFTLSQ